MCLTTTCGSPDMIPARTIISRLMNICQARAPAAAGKKPAVPALNTGRRRAPPAKRVAGACVRGRVARGRALKGEPQTSFMPADYEQQSALLLGVNELLPYHPHVLTELVAALVERIPLVAVVTGEAQRRDLLATLCDWGLPAHRLHSVFSAAVGLWVRDYGPTFVGRGADARVLDAEYWYPGRLADDRFPSDLARLLGLEARDVPLLVEGGNLLS